MARCLPKLGRWHRAPAFRRHSSPASKLRRISSRFAGGDSTNNYARVESSPCGNDGQRSCTPEQIADPGRGGQEIAQRDELPCIAWGRRKLEPVGVLGL